MKKPLGIKYYFVDEAGDTTLFNARGVRIIGKEGVSHTFMVGVADIPDPMRTATVLAELRRSLLADPYFKNVPSMQVGCGKTAECFHAKNDLPEVRREVFKLLPSLGAKVQVAIRRKADLADECVMMSNFGGRYRPSDVYDDLVKRLFKNLLHRGESHEVCFARRGKSDREEALRTSLDRARLNFKRSWKSELELPCKIRSSVPSQDAGLQVVDYYLWALQRLIERKEDRFFEAVSSQLSLVMDLDDKRERPYGRWYSTKDMISLEKTKPLES